MGLSWNDLIAIIPVIAKRKKTILEHNETCDTLISMFLSHFGYELQDEVGLEIFALLTNYYRSSVPREGLSIFTRDNSKEVLVKLSSIIHA